MNDNIQRNSSFRIPKTPVTRSKSVMVNNNFFPVANVKRTDEIKDLELHFKQQMSLKCRSDEYFSQCSDKTRIISSKKSLEELGQSKLTAAEAIRLIPKLPRTSCWDKINQRIVMLEGESFPRIFGLLRNKFNVICHGFGSKLGLLDRFVNRYLTGENCVIIPGVDAESVNLSQIFNDVIDSFAIPMSTQGKSLSSMATAIRDFFNNPNESRLYFIISNIERLGINTSLEPFVILAKCPNISILATVDHRFVERLLSKYDIFWLFYDWTTLLPYDGEVSASSSGFVSQNSTVGLDLLKTVSSSLHKNAKQVFLLLAKFQLEYKNQKTEGMLIENLLCLSKDSLFVTNEIGLRNLLTEFKDHKLIQIKMSADGSCYVKIVLDMDSIEKFVNNFNDF